MDNVDFIEISRILFDKKKVLVKFILVFFLIGLFHSFNKPNIYKSSSTFYPHYEQLDQSGGNLRNLAGLAGINLDSEITTNIPPNLYPKLINSTSFKLKLLNKSFNYKGERILYKDYLEDNYSKFDFFNFFISKVKVFFKLTFNKDVDLNFNQNNLTYIDKREFKLFTLLNENIFLEVNEKDGFIELIVFDYDPEISAVIALEAKSILQESIIDFKIKNIKEVFDFTSNQFLIAQQKLYQLQDSLANFKDNNINIRSDLFKNKLNRIETEFTIQKNIYNELAITKEKTAIDVRKNTPIFTIIDEVVVPNDKFLPDRKFIILIATLVGLIVGSTWVLVREPLKNIIETIYRK